ncbi:hypothetical protein FOZ63_032356, partial [Perkinsus olseni]
YGSLLDVPLSDEMSYLPPWEYEMLVRLRDKGDINLVPFPSSLPFPSPPSSKLEDLDDRCRGCEAVQLEILKRDLPEERARFVGSMGYLAKLDTPVTGEGLRISRISTSLDQYIPEVELKFDEDRLRELEEGADQVVPDSTKLSNEPYMVGMCDEKIRNYVKYIAEREGVPETYLMTEDNISAGVVLWLLTGKVHPRKPDNLDHWRGPYSTLHYKDCFRVKQYWQFDVGTMYHLTNELGKGLLLVRSYPCPLCRHAATKSRAK